LRLDTLPIPNDAVARFVTVPAETMAMQRPVKDRAETVAASGAFKGALA
jgi:hypothetical protein